MAEATVVLTLTKKEPATARVLTTIMRSDIEVSLDLSANFQQNTEQVYSIEGILPISFPTVQPFQHEYDCLLRASGGRNHIFKSFGGTAGPAQCYGLGIQAAIGVGNHCD